MNAFLRRFLLLPALVLVSQALVQFCVAQSTGTPHPDDVYWDYRFGHPLLTGYLNSGMAAANGKFYLSCGVGLSFKNGGRPYAMAVWDGTGWTYDGPVSFSIGADLVLPGAQGFTIAGNFSNLNGQNIRYMASWDGAKWDSLGPQLNGRVRALYPNSNGLYVGGEFTKFGDSVANRIALWGGSSWQKVIDVNTGNGVNGTVYAITGTSSYLYLGGSFGTAGGVTGVNRVVQWNWTSRQWGKLGNGFNNDVFALVSNLGTITAGGWFDHSGTDTVQNVGEFNGTKWVDIGDPLNVYPTSNAMYSPNTGGLYASGDFNLSGVHYAVVYRSGSTWSGLGDATRGAFFGLTGDGSNIYASAGQSVDGTKDYRGIGWWNGSSWSGMGNPIGIFFEFPSANYVGTLGYANGIVYAAGSFREAGDLVRTAGLNFVMFKNGKWQDVGGALTYGAGGGFVYGMATIGTDLYTGGFFSNIGATPMRNVGRWDGSTWTALGNGTNGTIKAMAAGSGGLFVAGTFDTAGTQRVNGIAKWDGAQWSRLGGGIGSGTNVMTMAVNGNDVVVAGGNLGNIDSARVVVGYGIARWNGSSWSSIPPLPDIQSTTFLSTSALAFIGNDLYAGANYYSGDYLGYVFKWDGTSWTQVGGRIGKGIGGLWPNGTDLYVAGNFKTIGTDTIWNVAKWDGVSWTPLGSGVTTAYSGGESGRAVLGTSDGLYVGGTFSQAGKYSSNNIALWKHYTPQSPSQSLNAPVQTSPANRATGQPTNAGLVWASVSNATSYHVQVSTDSTFTTVLVNDSTLAGTTRQLSGLSANTKYFWRVRSKNVSLTSWWSGFWSFKTGNAAGVEQLTGLPAQFELSQNYPNPFNPTSTIKFGIAQESNVKLGVYNMLGQLVQVLANQRFTPGYYTATIQGADLPSGIYLYRIEAGSFVDVKKIVLLK